jgi:hypothetical protein
MSDLLDNVYLPDLKKRSIRESDAYKLLKENNKDTSVLEGYENHPDAGTVNFESFDKFLGEGGTKEEWIARHATPEVQKEFFSNVGDFMLETGKDTVLSLATAVVNGADVATNLMPLFVKALDKAPFAIGMPEGFLNEANEKQVYDFANNISNNLGEARDYLNEFKKDDNFVSQLVGVMSQDLLYSIPIYNKLRAAGVPKSPAFFISGGFGGAIGIEQKIMGAESTFSQEFFAKDIIELKNLIGIIPNTPEDKIADEVIQALEYGAFSAAIPGIIDAFKFMKRYVPAMTATTGATIGMTADNEAEGSPLKAIVNAVDNIPMFKSAVVDAADNIPTVASGDQIFNTIKNTTGVKESELKWMDLEGFLKGKNKVSKDEVLEYINTNKIDVAEVTMSSSSKKGLPDDFRQTIDEYETRWRDSDLADGVTPNYDVYKFKSTTYKDADLVNRLGEPTQASTRANLSKDGLDVQELKGDFQSMNRNPLLQAMDADAEIFGTGTSFKVLRSMLIPWMDDTTGKYTGYLIDLDKGFANATNTNYYVVSTSNNRVLVPEVSLDTIGEGNFKRIAKYEIDELELERFNIEDDIRQFRLNNTDQSPLYEKYTSPGGTDYTELVFKIKNKEGTTPAILEGEFGTLGNNKVKSAQRTSINYTSPHFNRMNEFAHVRFKTRTLDNGKKVLAVEEMQSDLLQASKTELFDSANRATFNAPGGDKVLKDFPFKNNWYEFTIKRLTRYAADNGFDAIAIPKGELAANRYGQEINKLKTIVAVPNGPGSARITFADDKGTIFKTVNFNPNLDKEGLFFETLKKYEKDVGSKKFPEFQQMVIDATDEEPIERFIKYDKEEIVGTGKGKYNLYDKTIPSYMKKYANKWNAKVYDYRLSNPENPSIPVTVLELSNEMKTGVTSSSQPLFELFGGVSLATWGAQAVSDSMENNIISQKTN